MKTGKPNRRDLNSILRRDLASFVHRTFQTVSPGERFAHAWHIDVVAHYLEQCADGKIKRLIITLPPRSLKSICASVAFSAWVLGHRPTARIICASYSNDLSTKHARDCLAVMTSSWYGDVFPKTRLSKTKNAEAEFETTQRGFRLATSVGGTLTGRGGDLIIIDDPLKASDAISDSKREAANDWFRNTLFSRLDDKREGCIIVVMQRLHPDDLVGHLLSTNSGWTHLNLPAIAQADERFDIGMGRVFTRRAGEALHPDREPLDVLERIRREIGSYEFSAQYLQEPLAIDGGLIKWTWFRTYEPAPVWRQGDFVTQSWDTASKAGELNDFSVCTTWLRRGGDHFLLDVMRSRFEFPQLKRAVIQQAQRFKPDAVVIEDRGSGTQLIQELRHSTEIQPIAISPEADKATRMYAQSVKIERGAVWIPKDAPWLDEFRREVIQFPKGRYDDQIDSMSQYLGWIEKRTMQDAPVFIAESAVSQGWWSEFGNPGRY